MTSPAIRTAVKAELAANWTHCPVFDLSDYVSINDLPVGPDAKVLLIQWLSSFTQMRTIAQPERHGYQEQGQWVFHLLMPTGQDSAEALAWATDLQTLFLGKRLGSAIIDRVEQPTDLDGAAIRIDGKWHGWAVACAFYSVVCGGAAWA